MNKTVKADVIIPTVQFGNITYHLEDEPEEIMYQTRQLLTLWNGGFGLEEREFNKALDRYLKDGTGETETYMKMSREQQGIIQAIKRSRNRTKK